MAVALRSSAMRACLGLTVYVSSAAGPEGPREALEAIERAYSEHWEEGRGGGGGRVEEGEEEEEEEGGRCRPDSYLEQADVPVPLGPNITLVQVEALPRG